MDLILPPPATVQIHSDPFRLTQPELWLELANGVPISIGHRLERELASHGFRLLKTEASDGGNPLLRLWLDPDCLPRHPEGYRIEIDTREITLSSSTPQGLGHACSTIRQLLAHGIQHNGCTTIESGIVEDWPRLPYRGMHLDVSRHFFNVDEVKRYLDLLAFHKINHFHWHLTDDQGWRIEIPALPKLTSVGGFREGQSGRPYGGFYTHNDIRSVVDHARELGITIVPEIEMPGHSRAAIAAYPDLCCTGKRQPVPTTWGVFEDVLCVGREETFDFIETVLETVCDLFPGPYIHIGGDEVPIQRWELCPHCQRRVIDEYLLNTEALQGWFTTRIAEMVEAKGKWAIGWDEVLQGKPPASTVIMSWRGVEHGIKAAKMGHRVIMSPASHCYFDHSQGEHGEPEAFPAVLPLERVYQFEPVPNSLASEQQSLILGGQGNLWTERIPNANHLEYMLLPRLCALATVLWRGNNENDTAFPKQLRPHLELLGKLGYNYRPLNEE